MLQIPGKRTEEGFEAASAASTASVHAGTSVRGHVVPRLATDNGIVAARADSLFAADVSCNVHLSRICPISIRARTQRGPVYAFADAVPGTPVDSPYARRLSIGSDTQVTLTPRTHTLARLQSTKAQWRIRGVL